jgi:hypothetical protein
MIPPYAYMKDTNIMADNFMRVIVGLFRKGNVI